MVFIGQYRLWLDLRSKPPVIGQPLAGFRWLPGMRGSDLSSSGGDLEIRGQYYLVALLIGTASAFQARTLRSPSGVSAEARSKAMVLSSFG